MSPWIVWDERNVRHILGDNASRGIWTWEIEEVLRDPSARCRRLARDRLTGRRRHAYDGRTESGRLLKVIVEVVRVNAVRPVTVWEARR